MAVPFCGSGEGTAGGVVVGGRFVVAAGPDHDHHGDRHEQGEDAHVQQGGFLEVGNVHCGDHKRHFCYPADLVAVLVEFVAFDFVADFRCDRVKLPVRVADVPAGDGERGHELKQAHDQADVDVAPDLGGHELHRVVGQQDIGEVPEQECNGHRKDKAAVTFAQFLEPRRRLDFLEVHGRRSVRFLGFVTHRSSSLRLASPHRLPWPAPNSPPANVTAITVSRDAANIP